MSRKYNSSIFNECEPIIRKMVENWQKENKYIANQTTLVRELAPYLKEHTGSETTIRRILAKMDFYYHSPNSYGFNNPIVPFNNLVSYLGCQSHICFSLSEPSLGTFLAHKLNEHYSSFEVNLGDYIHCVAIQELLVCFYKKSPSKNITVEHLSKEIPSLLSQLYYAENDK